MNDQNLTPQKPALNWEDFLNPFDNLPSNVQDIEKNYQRGLAHGQEAIEFHISITGSWSTHLKTGGHCQAYEKIGYHAGTGHFLRGILDSGVEIIDHRQPALAIEGVQKLLDNGFEITRIPERIMAVCAYPVRIEDGKIFIDDFAVIDQETGKLLSE
jgi:hypothetical protein